MTQSGNSDLQLLMSNEGNGKGTPSARMGRLLKTIPAGRCRLEVGVDRLPKAGDLVELDQGFAGPEGEAMGLVYGVDKASNVLFEAEVYDSEIEVIPNDDSITRK